MKLFLIVLISYYCFSYGESKPLSGKDLSVGAVREHCECGWLYAVTNASGIGSLSSPGYPFEQYCNNMDCTYTLYAGGSPILITFPFFDLELGYDYVRLYDGRSTHSSDRLESCTGKTCGNVMSTQPYMTVEFKTDDSVKKMGFLAIFYSLSTLSTPMPTAAPTTALITTAANSLPVGCSCGSPFYDVTTQVMTFSSPNYPQTYNCLWERCQWYIQSLSGPVQIQFQQFHLGAGGLLSMYDGQIANAAFLLASCQGSHCPTITSTGQWMTITFSMNSNMITSNDLGFVSWLYSTGTPSPPMSSAGPQFSTMSGIGTQSSPMNTASPSRNNITNPPFSTEAFSTIHSP